MDIHGDFAAVARARAKERIARMSAGAVLGAIAYSLAPSPLVFVWGAAFILAQVPDALAYRPFTRPDAPEPTPRRVIACGVTGFISTGVFSIMAAYLWFYGGTTGQIVAMISIAGSLVHIGVLHHQVRPIFLGLIIPHLAQWLLLPLFSADRLGAVGVAVLEVTGVVFLLNLYAAARHARSNTLALRAARDEADLANRAKSIFLATMSHEIRTPLNGVLGMAQAMAAEPLAPAQAERLAVISQSGKALLAILNDVLDLSKIEAGRLELETLEFELRDILADAPRAYSAAAEAKGIGLDLLIDPDAEGRYLGDPTRVRQIVYNLVSNAVKFTHAGSVEIHAACASGGRLAIAVSDTGPGLSPDELSRLFERYAQADATRARTHGGTGLGLSISRELARLMDGEVTAASEPGRGSTFTLTIPLQRAAEAAAPAPASAPAPTAQPTDGQTLRVLVAEDNGVNRMVLKALLSQAGIEPAMTEDGVQAVDAWRAGDFDLILMDAQMPRLSGPAAARQIRAEEAASQRRRTPIIALTADVMTHHLADYRAAGMDGCVAKPIEVERLYAAINEALAGPEPLAEEAA